MTFKDKLKQTFAGAALAGALLFAAPHKAQAQHIGFGISIGGPVYGGYYAPGPYAYGPAYYGYPAYGPGYAYGGYYGPRFYGRGYGYGRGFYGHEGWEHEGWRHGGWRR